MGQLMVKLSSKRGIGEHDVNLELHRHGSEHRECHGGEHLQHHRYGSEHLEYPGECGTACLADHNISDHNDCIESAHRQLSEDQGVVEGPSASKMESEVIVTFLWLNDL